ncbi:MAG: hypothetical protein EAZ06_03365 [Cytophagales bacterium]|nr:MAG: hypothetical protein EAY69_07910 [Cytophagales bacterium]TAH30383.1 MAG: hypothetical protein EAZ06_03365 [Cytophagales bacterium]
MNSVFTRLIIIIQKNKLLKKTYITMKNLVLVLILLLAIFGHTVLAQQQIDGKSKAHSNKTNTDDEDDDDSRNYSRSLGVGRIETKKVTKEFKFDTKAKKVKISSISGKIEIQSHNKNEILIVGEISEREKNTPKDAEGLTKVTNSGGDDNTGMSINIKEEDGIVYIKRTSKEWEGGNSKYKIFIPEKMNLSINQKGYNGKSIKISNVKSEIEVKSAYSPVTIENVTGPLILSVTYAGAKISFEKLSQEKPSSIIGAYSKVDVTLPSDTKANLKLESDYGNIYTDFELQKDNKKEEDEDVWCMGCKNNIESKINGGGVELYLKSPYGNVYLRKKK